MHFGLSPQRPKPDKDLVWHQLSGSASIILPFGVKGQGGTTPTRAQSAHDSWTCCNFSPACSISAALSHSPPTAHRQLIPEELAKAV